MLTFAPKNERMVSKKQEKRGLLRTNRRKVVYVICAVVVVALGVFAAIRWRVWFFNPPEQSYHGLTEPGRVLLTFGNDGEERSRNVSWQCGEEVKESRVELVSVDSVHLDSMTVAATGEVFQSRSGRAAYYSAQLRNLKPDTSFRYRVVTNGKTSRWYMFRTYPQGRQRFEFMYVGDVQDTIGGEANRFLLEAWARHPQTEFLVCGGDLTERPTDMHWGETFRDVDSITQAMPLLNVTGNHDYLKGLICRLERRFSLVFSYFLDNMVGDSQVYTLRYGDAQFFLLDSNRELPYLLSQRLWLKLQLEASRAKWKILVLHHPLYSLKGNNNLVQRWLFNPLVEEYGVDLVLQGHEHAYARMARKQDDGSPTTPVYIVSHCSPKNYFIQFDDKFDRFGISSRYYQQVRIMGDTLSVASYEVYEHSLYDSILIVKPNENQPMMNPRVIDCARHIPENMSFTPQPGNKKEERYAERIREYCERHPERLK